MDINNNFSWQDKSREEDENARAQPDKIIFGGCGVRYGAIRRPAVPHAKRPRRTLWSILGFSQKSDCKE